VADRLIEGAADGTITIPNLPLTRWWLNMGKVPRVIKSDLANRDVICRCSDLRKQSHINNEQRLFRGANDHLDIGDMIATRNGILNVESAADCVEIII
jgi:hypothetical protein